VTAHSQLRICWQLHFSNICKINFDLSIAMCIAKGFISAQNNDLFCSLLLCPQSMGSYRREPKGFRVHKLWGSTMYNPRRLEKSHSELSSCGLLVLAQNGKGWEIRVFLLTSQTQLVGKQAVYLSFLFFKFMLKLNLCPYVFKTQRNDWPLVWLHWTFISYFLHAKQIQDTCYWIRLKK
jgi:hypothetical protein